MLLLLLLPPIDVQCCAVCMGLPDAGLLGGTADWPAACEGTVFGGRCRAKCKDGLFGNPTVLCWNGWSTFVVGACKDKPGTAYNVTTVSQFT